MTSFSNPKGLKQSEVVRITGDDETKAATVFEDSDDNKNRIAVEAKFEGITSGLTAANIIDPQWCAGYIFDTETTYSGGAWADIYNENGEGVLFGFHIVSDTDKLQARLIIDTKTIFEVSVNLLKAVDFEINKSLQYQNKQIFGTDGQEIDFSPCWPILYRNNLTVQVKRTDNNDVKVKSVFIFATRKP